METNLYSITIPPMIDGLAGLSAILDKVAGVVKSKASEWHPYEKQEAAFLSERIVFDQFDLKRQIQVACDHAKGCAARLSGIEAPVFADTEQTIAELKARIQQTIDFLKSVDAGKIIGQEERQVTISYFPGKYFTGFDYATRYAVPNFYFHMVTAYSIIRKNGVDVGKADFAYGLPLKDLV